MAEPLKNRYGPDVPERIAAMIKAVHPAFASSEFLSDVLNGYEELELTPRARRISEALARYLPADRVEAIEILVVSLGPKIDIPERWLCWASSGTHRSSSIDSQWTRRLPRSATG